MTRPIYEPTYARTDRKLGFSADQLFRRPGRPLTGGVAIYEIKVFEDINPVLTGDDAFVWEIPEDLDGAAIVKVEAFISTAGADDLEVQIRQSDPCDTGTDILSTPITIDAGDCNSKDAAVQPVISGGQWDVAWGDHLHIDVDADGDGAKGLGVIVTLTPSALASVILQGAEGPQGAPGGITAWMGEWDAGTTYNPDEAVSHLGSSYVAINTNTNVEPGVDAGWETDWMLLAAGSTTAAGTELAYVEFTSNVTVSASSAASPTDVVSSGAITYAATRICIEFFAPIVEPSSGDFINLTLWDASTQLGDLTSVSLSSTRDVPVMVRRFLTPTAASHTYRIRAYRFTNNGTIYGNAGTANTYMPGYIRVTIA